MNAIKKRKTLENKFKRMKKANSLQKQKVHRKSEY